MQRWWRNSLKCTALRRAKAARPAACRHRPLWSEALEPRTLLAVTPQLLTDMNLGPAGIFVHGPIAALGGIGFFSGGYGAGDYELWRTDGTTAGTTLVKDINPGA